MIKYALKMVFGTAQGRWGIGTLITGVLFLNGQVQLSILSAIYSQMFFISHAVDEAAGNPTDSSEVMMESAVDMVENEQVNEMVENLIGGNSEKKDGS